MFDKSVPKAVSRGGTPNKRYKEGRRCTVLSCGTVLSAYNKRNKCFVHQDPEFAKSRGKKVA